MDARKRYQNGLGDRAVPADEQQAFQEQGPAQAANGNAPT